MHHLLLHLSPVKLQPTPKGGAVTQVSKDAWLIFLVQLLATKPLYARHQPQSAITLPCPISIDP